MTNHSFNILVIDDNDGDFKRAKEMLIQTQGGICQVDWASSFESGRLKLRSNHYKAVLVDNQLGAQSGLELIREAVEQDYPAPLILMTDTGSNEAAIEALQAGAILSLTKTDLSPQLLDSAVHYAVEMKLKQCALQKNAEQLSKREEALLASETRFRASMESMLDGFVVLSAIWDDQTPEPNQKIVDFRYEYVNQKACELLHHTRDELIGHKQSEINPRFRLSENFTRAAQVLNTGEPIEFEELHYSDDSKHPEKLSEAFYVRINKLGSEIVVTRRDITARKKDEFTLRSSEARLIDFLESIHESFFALDRDWRFTYVNQRFCRLLEKTPDQLLGKVFWEEMPIYLGTPVEENYRKAMQERLQVEFQIGGFYSPRWYDVSIYPTQEGISVFAVDLTEEKKAEIALQASENRLQRLFDTSVVGIMTRDMDGNIIDANKAFLAMTGYTRADIETGHLHTNDLLPDEYRSLEEQIMEEVRVNGLSMPYEKEFIRKDGSRIPVLVGHTRLDGIQTEVIGFITDLSELKQAQADLEEYAEKLKRSNQELEQFAFIASHDLREPLRKIRAFGDKLQYDLGSELADEPKDILNRMLNAAERMQGMIEALLELSRVNTHGQSFAQVDLSEVADEVVSDLESQIQRTGGQIEIGALPVVQADPMQMHQLLQNLIGNALKFHKPEEAPRVQVKGEIRRGKEPAAVLQVQDNGIGFEEQYFERILQPFQRLQGRTAYEGTGMGLAICNRIVERHHGKIEAHSQPGEGTTFIITLPLKLE